LYDCFEMFISSAAVQQEYCDSQSKSVTCLLISISGKLYETLISRVQWSASPGLRLVGCSHNYGERCRLATRSRWTELSSEDTLVEWTPCPHCLVPSNITSDRPVSNNDRVCHCFGLQLLLPILMNPAFLQRLVNAARHCVLLLMLALASSCCFNQQIPTQCLQLKSCPYCCLQLLSASVM